MSHDSQDTVGDCGTWNRAWQDSFQRFVAEQLSDADAGHGIEHVMRVVENGVRLAKGTSARVDIFLPAAWLHDCVIVPKNSPFRHRASRMAAERAAAFLAVVGYPQDLVPSIEHCIVSHSFSAGIPCESLEAQLLQDADRLEALGAIGLARCLMTGGAMRQRLYHPDEPFPTTRPPDDSQQSIDHFFCKLLGLHRTMQTAPGRAEAIRRTRFLMGFLKELATEIDPESRELTRSLEIALADFPELV